MPGKTIVLPAPDDSGFREIITCRDGTTLSVQTGQYYHSTPQDDTGPWGKAEVGFIRNPSGRVYVPAGWGRYGGPEVFDYVPMETVNDLIMQHGGRRKAGGDY